MLSHAVIEHVADAPLYLRECARVLAPGGHVYLSTAPYLSFAGAHLPRLKLQLPLHLMVGRRAAFATFRFLARHAAWTLKEPANENSFIKAARRGEVKEDDLLEKVRVSRLRGQIADAGLRIVREELHATATVRRLPAPIGRWLRDSPLTQDALISNMEYVLARAASLSSGPVESPAWRRSPDIGRKTGGRWTRCTGASSATTPPRRAACGGNGRTRRNPNNPGQRARDLDCPRGHGHRRAVRDDARAGVGARAQRGARFVGHGRHGRARAAASGAWARCCSAPGTATSARRSVSGCPNRRYRLFQKLRWPDVGPVPCLVKPLTRRALRRPNWPQPVNRLVSALTLPVVKIVARTRPLSAEVRLIQRFDDSFTELWDELAPKFDLAVRRDAAYLNWKFVAAPHVRYSIAALRPRRPQRRLRRVPSPARASRPGHAAGRLPRRPGRRGGHQRRCCAGSIARRGRPTRTRSGRSRCTPRSAASCGARGYFQVKSTMEFVVKVNGLEVPPTFYDAPTRWHVTLGDSDQDR